MRKKRQENLVTAGLALCVAILALLAVCMDVGKVSTARDAPAEETLVIGLWEAGNLTDTILPGKQPPVLSIEATPQPTPELVQRYSSVVMTADERLELAEQKKTLENTCEEIGRDISNQLYTFEQMRDLYEK